MMLSGWRMGAVAIAAGALLAVSCNGKSSSTAAGSPGPTPPQDSNSPPPQDSSSPPPQDSNSSPPQEQDGPVLPLRVGNWTYHGVPQGLSPDVHDVSADESGNVYVAADDALYARAKGAEKFLRFDADNAGLSKRCNDAAYIFTQPPPTPMVMCPILSVAGASPGKAFIGFWGFGAEADPGVEWAVDSGGVDVVAFDPAAGTMARTRHVLTGAPPHVVCDYGHTQWEDKPCVPPPGTPPLKSTPWWDWGRRLLRRVTHIAVNHDPSTLMYGDAWMGGNHATMAVLLNNTSQRNWKDTTAGVDPAWADAKDFWEHLHPIVVATAADGTQIENYGECQGISVSPLNGAPWASNGYRTATTGGYGVDLTFRNFGMLAIDVWPDGTDPYPIDDAQDDFVRAVSHCKDGTLWVASTWHGLAALDTSGKVISYVPLPEGVGAQAIACDWSDDSLWVGPTTGGLMRYRNGAFETVAVPGAPAFASQSVQNIQFDRWSGGNRVVYFAFGAVKDANGSITAPGGVAAYDGP